MRSMKPMLKQHSHEQWREEDRAITVSRIKTELAASTSPGTTHTTCASYNSYLVINLSRDDKQSTCDP